MRLSDARLRQAKTKLIYPNHRPSPWLTEAVVPRSLEPIVRTNVYPCDYVKSDLPIATNRGVAIKTAAARPVVASPRVSLTLLLPRRGAAIHSPVRFELSVNTTARRAVPTNDTQNAGGKANVMNSAIRHALRGQITAPEELIRPILMCSNIALERRGDAPPPNETDLSRSSTPS